MQPVPPDTLGKQRDAFLRAANLKLRDDLCQAKHWTRCWFIGLGHEHGLLTAVLLQHPYRYDDRADGWRGAHGDFQSEFIRLEFSEICLNWTSTTIPCRKS